MKKARGIPLINHEEEVELKRIVEEYLEQNPNLAKHPHLSYLYESMSVHHAGMLPSWKALVEKLFQRGLLKVVFATETLAAGINMPARTTVISSLSKRGDEGARNLTASEFLQMSGRAGRRGMDEVGHVVVLNHPFESVEDAAKLAAAPPDPLQSRFTPSYGMVLNLLQRHTIDEARELIEKSFGQFLIDLQSGTARERRQEYVEELERLSKPLCPDRIGDLPLYAKKLDAVKALHQQIKAIERGSKHGGGGSSGGSTAAAVQSLRVQIKDILNDAYAMPCHGCPVQKPCSKQTDHIRHLQGRLKDLDRYIQHATGRYWNTFMALCDILRHEAYLSGYMPTESGQMAAGIRGTNELFLAEVVSSGVLNNLQPARLAAVLCALVGESGRSDAVRVCLDPAVESIMEKISKIARGLHRLQRDFDVDISISFDFSLSPLAQMWAGGCSWQELLIATTYDEGDIVRMLRRTLDLARQFTYAPHTPESLVKACHAVESLIARDELKQEM
jgi:superfamily II RNA helicase